MLYAKPRVLPRGFVLLCVGLAVVMGVLAGCGGGSNLGMDNLAVTAAGSVSPQALDPAMVGTWMMIWGTKDGVVVAPKNITGWDTGTTRGLSVMRANGTITSTEYNATGGIVKQMNGTWTGSGGTGTIHWTTGSMTDPIPFTYTPQGANVATTTISVPGFHRVMHSVKIVSPTGHDPALVKTWTATGVWVNGVSKPISYLTGSTLYPKFARRFAAAGTSQDYLLKADMTQKAPKLAPKSWASGGGVLKLGTGPISEAIYVVTTGQLTTWQLDAAGNTLKVVYSRYGAAGAHDARLVASWHAVSVKVDGASVPLATFFKWETGENNSHWTFWVDGTLEQNDRAGTTLIYGGLRTWFTSAGKITIIRPGTTETGVAAYSLPTSTSLKFTMTQGGHTTVLIWNKDA